MSEGILRAGKYAAKQASAKAVSALDEPLLPTKQSRRTDSLSDGSEDTSVQSESMLPSRSMSVANMAFTALLGVVTAGGIAASAASMIAVQSVAVLLMGGLCAVQSPAVMVNQVRLAWSAGVRESINNIRASIEMLENEIDFLSSTVDELETDSDTLISMENDLRKIAVEQNSTVEEIVELVNENEEILSEMKTNLRQIFVASMAEIVLRSDKDGDMKIDRSEIKFLALRLKIHLETFDISLDTDKFEQMLHKDNDIQNVLRFCGEVLFNCDDCDSDDDKDDDESDVTFDFESFCLGLDEEEDCPPNSMTREDRLSMISVEDKYTQGSVDVARGKRATIMSSKSQREVRRKTVLKKVKGRQTMMKVATERRNLRLECKRPSLISRWSGEIAFSDVVVVK